MSKKTFIGNWRITEMEQWDQDFIDAEVPGYISFGENGMGEFQFGYVHGLMDCRYSDGVRKQTVEFSWEGNDEMDRTFGRGFAFVKDDILSGHLFFHEGDDSEFKATRDE
jgi:hypothetical protein